MGYTPITLNQNNELYLRQNGVTDAGSLDNAKEYRWVEQADLTWLRSITVQRYGHKNIHSDG